MSYSDVIERTVEQFWHTDCMNAVWRNCIFENKHFISLLIKDDEFAIQEISAFDEKLERNHREIRKKSERNHENVDPSTSIRTGTLSTFTWLLLDVNLSADFHCTRTVSMCYSLQLCQTYWIHSFSRFFRFEFSFENLKHSKFHRGLSLYSMNTIHRRSDRAPNRGQSNWPIQMLSNGQCPLSSNSIAMGPIKTNNFTPKVSD